MDGNFEVDGVFLRSRLKNIAVNVEDGFDLQDRPNLAALVGNNRELDIFVVQTAPGNLAKRGQGGTELYKIVRNSDERGR